MPRPSTAPGPPPRPSTSSGGPDWGSAWVWSAPSSWPWRPATDGARPASARSPSWPWRSFAYSGSVAAGTNGFIAAFVAGMAFGALDRGEDVTDLRFTEEGGTLLSLLVWFMFGAVMLGPGLADVGWRTVVFALLALSVVRMVPVALALLGSGLDRATVGFVGWFGPRGLASVVFGLIAVDTLAPAEATVVLGTVTLTVALSVLLHGVSASPLAARYGARMAPVAPGATRARRRGADPPPEPARPAPAAHLPECDRRHTGNVTGGPTTGAGGRPVDSGDPQMLHCGRRSGPSIPGCREPHAGSTRRNQPHGTTQTRKERTLASEGLHEPLNLLDEASIDYHRAMTSLGEELEAIDWYDQRVKATSDESLAAVLAYNRDDEKEHAAMALEWLRRRDAALDAQLRKFLFSSGPITEVGDQEPEGGSTSSAGDSGSLGIGSLKGTA